MGIEVSSQNESELDIPAFIFAMIYTLVPIAFFYQYYSGMIKPERVSILGILFLYFNGLTYFIATIKTGVKPNKQIHFRDFSNLSGAILGFGYCLYYCFIMYYKNHRNKFLFCILLIILSLAAMILLGIVIPNIEIFEYIGAFFNAFEYLPLGFDLFYLIKHKKYERYLLFSAIPGIFNTVIWLVWAAMTLSGDEKKIHSFIANILGFLLCVTQFIIYFLFKKNEDIVDEDLLAGEESVDDSIKKFEKREKETIYDI